MAWGRDAGLLSQLFCQRVVPTGRWTRHDIRYSGMFLLYCLTVLGCSFVTVGRLSRREVAGRWTPERVMILNCSRVDCITGRLYSPCYWPSGIFSLYGLSETCSLILDYRTRTSIAPRYWHDYSSQCSIKWVAPTGHDQLWTRHDTGCQTAWVNCITREIESAMLLAFRYVPAIWLDLDLLHGLSATWLYSLSMSMSCS